MFTNKKYVYEVYKAKSFSKAAENLFISQPSLSLTIKKIEEKIGAQLFDRSTNPIKLTDSGEEYIRCAEKIMDIEESFELYLSNLNDLRTGSLSIGASNFFAAYILAPIIALFKLRYPNVRVNLIEASTAELEKQLYSGELDLIIDNYNFDEQVYKKDFFYREQMILAVPKNLYQKEELQPYQLTAEDIIQGHHLLPETLAVPLSLLDGIPVILLRYGNDTRSRADKIFKEGKIHTQLVLELDQLATAFHVACHGIGATLISDTLVREIELDKRVVYYKIDSEYALRKNYFYFKHNKYITKAMKEFLKIATEEK